MHVTTRDRNRILWNVFPQNIALIDIKRITSFNYYHIASIMKKSAIIVGLKTLPSSTDLKSGAIICRSEI